MRANEVSTCDHTVVDCDGTVWIAGVDDRWRYLTDSGLCDWDSRYDLPAEYEPYTRLDGNARRAIKRGLEGSPT